MTDIKGYAKAQRAYDSMMPPDDGDEEECRNCEGTGKIDESNCCGAPFVHPDILMCSDCKEHCDRSICEECNGTGIDRTATQSRKEALIDYKQMKAEEQRLEEQMYEPRDREQFIERNEI